MQILLLGALALLSAGCGREPQSARPGARPQTVLLRGIGNEPDSLDPQKARSTQAQDILRDVCEGLTSVGRDANVAPGAAREWSVSADGRTYTFHLRPGLRWSNGDTVVAADFVAGLRRLVTPATASPYADVVEVIANAHAIITGKQLPETLGIAAPDDTTVVVTLEAPAPYLPALLAHPSTCPIHRPTLARAGDGFARPGAMVSNGAYVLREWVPGSHVRAERNPRYWNDAATHIDVVRYLSVADESAELTRYRADELDITAVVPRGQLDWIRAHIAGELHVSPQLATYFYGFNLDRAPFGDHPNLRRALSMVIDRERLTVDVLRAGEQPAYGWVPPGIYDYSPQSFDYRALPLAERIARARRLYAEAGYSAMHPLRFELRYSANEVNSRVAVAVASMWKEALGAEARLTAVEFKSLLADIDRRDVEVFLSNWVADYNDAYTFAQYLKSDFGVNLPHYRSAEYDALVSAAGAATDLGKRRALLEQAERVALRDHPLIPIYFYVNKHLVKPRVAGWYDNALNVVYSKDLSLPGSQGPAH
ncbi:MAG TPA: peptide ABC transporter substrate-binding protein [Steroidobacteraceae bacterium]|nr:peptide ABC transporter substrate-binding protein [Steroidobacteraceae bacterium]